MNNTKALTDVDISTSFDNIFANNSGTVRQINKTTLFEALESAEDYQALKSEVNTLQESVNGIDTTTDTTLTKTGKAADAKITGDKLATLKEKDDAVDAEISSLKESLENRVNNISNYRGHHVSVMGYGVPIEGSIIKNENRAFYKFIPSNANVDKITVNGNYQCGVYVFGEQHDRFGAGENGIIKNDYAFKQSWDFKTEIFDELRKKDYKKQGFIIVIKRDDESSLVDTIDDLYLKIYSDNDWLGQIWVAYGTSMTSTEKGKYADYVADELGLRLINKGIPGGGICKNQQIKNAIMKDDEKKYAKLITLEISQNDFHCNKIGDVYDNNDDSFCGCLNQCIQYLQKKSDAQIVVMTSTIDYLQNNNTFDPKTTAGEDNHTFFDLWEAVRKVCHYNSVYYIGMGDESGLGFARMSEKYIIDTLHHTDIGGYNLACCIVNKLKMIPRWYTKIPEFS